MDFPRHIVIFIAASCLLALAIGQTEKFTFFSLIGAVIKASSLDRWFFKK